MQSTQGVIPPRAVVFDVYGTLLSIGKPRRPYRQLLDLLASQGRIGRPEDARTVMTIEAGIAGTADALGGDLSISQLAALEESLFEELASVRLFPDVPDALIQLRERRIRLAVCSNLAAPYAVPIHLLLPEMDAYGFSFQLGAVKPEPRIYEAVCEAFGLPPSQVLMVGDTFEADVLGPIAFGMQAIHLVRPRRRVS